jgi:acetyl-CoA acetyltransferase
MANVFIVAAKRTPFGAFGTVSSFLSHFHLMLKMNNDTL